MPFTPIAFCKTNGIMVMLLPYDERGCYSQRLYQLIALMTTITHGAYIESAYVWLYAQRNGCLHMWAHADACMYILCVFHPSIIQTMQLKRGQSDITSFQVDTPTTTLPKALVTCTTHLESQTALLQSCDALSSPKGQRLSPSFLFLHEERLVLWPPQLDAMEIPEDCNVNSFNNPFVLFSDE